MSDHILPFTQQPDPLSRPLHITTKLPDYVVVREGDRITLDVLGEKVVCVVTRYSVATGFVTLEEVGAE